ncbi:MAG: M23 family metallopeptidase [Pseudomonadota bacterium]
MHRKPSPIRHDYNISANPRGGAASRPHHVLWFVAGLGLPLLALILGLAFRDAAPTELTLDAATDTVTASAAAPARAEVLLDAQPAVELPAATEPPAPAYDSLVLKVASGDTLDGLFRKNQLNIADLITISRLPDAKQPLRVLKPGDELEITHDAGRIMSLARNLDLHNRLEVNRDDAGRFTATLEERAVEYRQVMRHGVIETSLFESAAAIGLSDKVIMNVAGIFAWDIDFVYDIRVGDEYYVIFEELWQDGEKIDDGEIVAAEFVNQGDAYQALRYISPDGSSDYFNPDGRSVRKAFVRAPVDFKRISSGFNPNRRHPILNTIRAHRGVDYSAPRGTPVMAAGDGKISFRGTKNGYGRVVILQHGGNISTLYAHLSNFRKGQGVGTRVKQGQVIGFVGMTGLATAPHLHYEYRLNGVHRNPRTVSLPQADPIRAEFREDFERMTGPVLAELERFKRMQMASIDTGEAAAL